MKRVRLLICVAVCMILVLGLTACGAKTSEMGAVNSALNDDGLNESITADVAEPEGLIICL